jgi:hypothetical protein
VHRAHIVNSKSKGSKHPTTVRGAFVGSVICVFFRDGRISNPSYVFDLQR